MSLRILPIPPIPEETARVAHAAFPHGTLLMLIRDGLGTLYTNEDFVDLFPSHGQPAEAPWRLALVSVFQYVEGLTDRQAADAVRSRLDWKYALSLELTDPGFDHTVLSEFRTRLLQGGAEQRVLDVVLEQARARGWLKERGRQRTDSTHVLPANRSLTAKSLCVSLSDCRAMPLASRATLHVAVRASSEDDGSTGALRGPLHGPLHLVVVVVRL